MGTSSHFFEAHPIQDYVKDTKKTPQKREIAAFSRTLQITGSNAFYRTLG